MTTAAAAKATVMETRRKRLDATDVIFEWRIPHICDVWQGAWQTNKYSEKDISVLKTISLIYCEHFFFTPKPE